MSELKPCPFCGNKEIECGMQGSFYDMTLLAEKVGEWAEDVDGAYICSACGCYDYEASKYCPNCGAKMEAVNDGK